MRRRCIVLAGAVLALTATPAASTPAVGEIEWAQTTLVVTTGATRIRISVDFDQPRTADPLTPQRLAVGLLRCARTCANAKGPTWIPATASYAMVGDAASAQLTTTLFGRPLVIDWQGGDVTVEETVVELYDPVLPMGQVNAYKRRFRDGTATVTYGSWSCRTGLARVGVDTGFFGEVRTTEAEPTHAPPGFADLTRARCS